MLANQTVSPKFEELRTMVVPLSPGTSPHYYEIIFKKGKPHFVFVEVGEGCQVPTKPFDYCPLLREIRKSNSLLIFIPQSLREGYLARAPIVSIGAYSLEPYKAMHLDKVGMHHFERVCDFLVTAWEQARGDMLTCWEKLEQEYSSVSTVQKVIECSTFSQDYLDKLIGNNKRKLVRKI